VGGDLASEVDVNAQAARGGISSVYKRRDA